MSCSRIEAALKRAKDDPSTNLVALLQDALKGMDLEVESAEYVDGHYLSVLFSLPSRNHRVRAENDWTPYVISDALDLIPLVALIIEQDQNWVKLGGFQCSSHGSVYLGFHEFTIQKLAISFHKTVTRWTQWKAVLRKILEGHFSYALDWDAFLRAETEKASMQIPDSIRTQAYYHLFLASRSLFHSVLTRQQLEHREIQRLLEWLKVLHAQSLQVEYNEEYAESAV